MGAELSVAVGMATGAAEDCGPGAARRRGREGGGGRRGGFDRLGRRRVGGGRRGLGGNLGRSLGRRLPLVGARLGDRLHRRRGIVENPVGLIGADGQHRNRREQQRRHAAAAALAADLQRTDETGGGFLRGGSGSGSARALLLVGVEFFRRLGRDARGERAAGDVDVIALRRLGLGLFGGLRACAQSENRVFRLHFIAFAQGEGPGMVRTLARAPGARLHQEIIVMDVQLRPAVLRRHGGRPRGGFGGAARLDDVFLDHRQAIDDLFQRLMHGGKSSLGASVRGLGLFPQVSDFAGVAILALGIAGEVEPLGNLLDGALQPAVGFGVAMFEPLGNLRHAAFDRFERLRSNRSRGLGVELFGQRPQQQFHFRRMGARFGFRVVDPRGERVMNEIEPARKIIQT